MSALNAYCGLKQQPPGYRFETADYDLFQVIYVGVGEVFMAVQNHVIALRPGMLAYLPLGSAFCLHCEEMDYQGVFVTMSGELEALYRGEPRALVSTPEIRTVAGLIDFEARNPGDRTESILTHLGLLLVNLGIRLQRAQHDAGAGSITAEAWVRYACQSIQKTIYTSQSLEECLTGIPLGYRQLSRHFHAVMGQTPKQYQMECRLKEAERLLQATRLPITAIALELGFASSQHFSTQFTRDRGITPSEYRQTVRCLVP